MEIYDAKRRSIVNRVKSFFAGHGWFHTLCLAACIGIPVAFVGYGLFSGASLGELFSGSILLPLILCAAMHFVMMKMMGNGACHGNHQEEQKSDGHPASEGTVKEVSTIPQIDRAKRSILRLNTRPELNGC